MNNSYLNFVYQNKKLFGLFVLLVSLIIIMILVLVLRGNNPPSQPPPIISYQPSPTPSATYIPQLGYKKLLDEDAKDLHWLSNHELSFTSYHETTKHRTLNAVDLTNSNEATLINDVSIKMSELYWSSNNDLIIFDYGEPYITYLYSYASRIITKTGLNGYGYSWSPDGDSIFYYDLSNNPPSPKIYNIKTNTSALVNITGFPPFVTSNWSPSSARILLYNFNLETGQGRANILNLSTNSIDQVKTGSLLFPSWSPSGDKLAYVSNGGVYYTDTNNSTIIYNTDSNTQLISYAWINNNDLIILDGGKIPAQFILASTGQKNQKTILKELSTKSDQRAQFAISPDSNTLAIALEKDGLWIIKQSKLYK